MGIFTSLKKILDLPISFFLKMTSLELFIPLYSHLLSDKKYVWLLLAVSTSTTYFALFLWIQEHCVVTSGITSVFKSRNVLMDRWAG